MSIGTREASMPPIELADEVRDFIAAEIVAGDMARGASTGFRPNAEPAA